MAEKTITATIKVRESSTSDWTSKNPVLASGEFGYDWLAKVLKIGDGITKWNSLNPINGGSSSSVTVVQTTGSSTTSVMSQNAVTTNLNNKQDKFETSGTSRDVNMTPYLVYAKSANVLRNIKLNGSFYTVNFGYKELSTPYHVATSPTTSVTTIQLSSIIPSDEYTNTSNARYEIDLYIQMYSSSGSETKLWLWSDYYNATYGSQKLDEYKIAATSNYGRMQCVQLRITARNYIKYSASKAFGDFYLTVCGYRRVE